MGPTRKLSPRSRPIFSCGQLAPFCSRGRPLLYSLRRLVARDRLKPLRRASTCAAQFYSLFEGRCGVGVHDRRIIHLSFSAKNVVPERADYSTGAATRRRLDVFARRRVRECIAGMYEEGPASSLSAGPCNSGCRAEREPPGYPCVDAHDGHGVWRLRRSGEFTRSREASASLRGGLFITGSCVEPFRPLPNSQLTQSSRDAVTPSGSLRGSGAGRWPVVRLISSFAKLVGGGHMLSGYVYPSTSPFRCRPARSPLRPTENINRRRCCSSVHPTRVVGVASHLKSVPPEREAGGSNA